MFPGEDQRPAHEPGQEPRFPDEIWPAVGERRRDAVAHRHPEDVGPRPGQLFADGGHVAGEVSDGQRRSIPARVAVSARVDADDPESRRERPRGRRPERPAHRERVQQHDRLAVPGYVVGGDRPHCLSSSVAAPGDASRFGTPSAASRIIRARIARPDGTLGSRARSPSFSVTLTQDQGRSKGRAPLSRQSHLKATIYDTLHLIPP
jgi:hypothetical protein